MATNFPTSIDSFTNPTSGDTLDSPSHSAQHANINDAMVAVQTKLGVGSGTIGTWTSYTPTLTASVTNPTLGTGGAVYGLYTKINDLLIGTVYISFGSSGTSAGNGTYRVSLPVSGDTADVSIIAGQAMLYDASVTTFRHAAVDSDSTYLTMYLSDNVSPSVTHASPFSWTNFDQLRVQFIYKAA